MLLVEDHILSRLDDLLTHNAIEKKIEEFEDSSYWYKHSYKTFISRFNETRGQASSEAWIERTALMYSWLPKIPLLSFKLESSELAKTLTYLTELESIFYDADLSTIGKTPYLGHSYHGEPIFSSYKGSYDLSIREFLEPAGRLLHKNANINTQLSSTTKLLHFMCPGLFPIFDTKICSKIFGTKHQTFDKYNAYIFSIQQYLKEGAEAIYIKKVASDLGVSPLYVIDLVIFDAKA